MVYYGLSFSAPYIGISTYLYIFLAAAVEVPAFFVVQVLIQIIGRRIVLIVGIIISGLSCLFILATPNGKFKIKYINHKIHKVKV